MNLKDNVKTVSDFFMLIIIAIFVATASLSVIFISTVVISWVLVWNYTTSLTQVSLFSAVMMLAIFIIMYLGVIQKKMERYEKSVAYQKSELKALTSYGTKLVKILLLGDQKLKSTLRQCTAQSPKVIVIDSYKIQLKSPISECTPDYLRSIIETEKNKVEEGIKTMKLPPKPKKYAKWEKRLGLILT